MLKPFQDGLVATAQADSRIDPGAMQRSENRPGQLFIRLSYAIQFSFQFRSKAAPLLGLLIKKSLQVRPLHLRGRLLITLLSVLAGLNKFFKNTDSVIHVHDFLLHFGCPEGARVGEIRRMKCPRNWPEKL